MSLALVYACQFSFPETECGFLTISSDQPSIEFLDRVGNQFLFPRQVSGTGKLFSPAVVFLVNFGNRGPFPLVSLLMETELCFLITFTTGKPIYVSIQVTLPSRKPKSVSNRT